MGSTGPDTGPIERDIERARADMAATLYVLGDRLAPKKLVARLKENVRVKIAQKVEDLKERVSPPRLVRRAAASLQSSDDTQGARRAEGRAPSLSSPARPTGELPRGTVGSG